MLGKIIVTPALVQNAATTLYSIAVYMWQGASSHDLVILEQLAEQSKKMNSLEVALVAIATSTGINLNSTSPFYCNSFAASFGCADTQENITNPA